MADNNTVLFLKNHGLERLTEIFVREELKLSDFQFLRDHPEELQQLLPKLRDRIDFLKAATDNVSRAVQVDLEPPIVCREVSSFFLLILSYNLVFIIVSRRCWKYVPNMRRVACFSTCIKWKMKKRYILQNHGI